MAASMSLTVLMSGSGFERDTDADLCDEFDEVVEDKLSPCCDDSESVSSDFVFAAAGKLGSE
jgi:hypothetical protein